MDRKIETKEKQKHRNKTEFKRSKVDTTKAKTKINPLLLVKVTSWLSYYGYRNA